MKRLLLDENLPRQLKSHFSSEFDVLTVPDLGWQSKKNGELLTAIDDEGIHYLLTADRNLRFQQNLDKYALIVVVLISFDTRLKTIAPVVADIESEILNAESSAKVIEIDVRTKTTG
jgi:hypothetical protein